MNNIFFRDTRFHVLTPIFSICAVCFVLLFGVLSMSYHRLHAQGNQFTDSTRAQVKRVNFDILSAAADAEKPLFLRYGLWGAAQWNSQNANFSTVRGFETTVPKEFGQQNALQILLSPSAAFGAMLELPLLGRLGAGLRLSYSSVWSSFVQREPLALFRLPNNELGTGELEHRFSARIANIFVEPVVTFRLLDALTVHAGVNIRYMPSPTFSSETVSLEPAPRFADGTRLRDVVQDQPIVRRSNGLENVEYSLVGGLSYEIPLNATGTVLFAPEIFYQHPLGGMLGNVAANVIKADGSAGEWQLTSLRAAAALRWSPFRTIRPELTPELQEKIQELKRYDSLVTVEKMRNDERLRQVDSANRVITTRMEEMKKLGVIARITKLYGVSAYGQTISPLSIEAEEFRASVQYQLLPIIQFDEQSAKLPLRYRTVNSAERSKFNLSQFADKQPFEAYRHILNIIGKRMNDIPSSVLFLNASSAASNEQNPAQMAERRALAVSGYLQDVWKIAEKRLIIRKEPSSKQNAENRTVEMSANTPEILAPIVFDVVRRRIEPEKIIMETEVSVGQGLKQWRVEARQFQENEDVLLKELQGGVVAPTRLEWAIADENSTQPQSGQDIVVQMTVTDIKNINTESPLLTIPVRQKSIVQKEAEGMSGRMQNLTFVRLAEAFPDDETTEMIARLKKSLQNASQIIFRYMNEKGRANVQRLMEICGLKPNSTIQIRQVQWGGLQLPETLDVQAYSSAVEVEIR